MLGKFCETMFFQGEIGNPLKEQTVCFQALKHIHHPIGKMLFIHKAHLLFKGEQATPLLGKILLAVILIYSTGWRVMTIWLGMCDAWDSPDHN